MKLTHLLTVSAILSFIFGTAFLLVPVQTIGLYGLALDPAGVWMTRYLGGALVGYGALNWAAREVAETEGIQPIVVGNLVAMLVGLVVGVLNGIYRDGNLLVWSTPAIYLALSAGFAYFEFGKSTASAHLGRAIPH